MSQELVLRQLIERDSRYSFMSTYEMRVVAEKRYRLADEPA